MEGNESTPTSYFITGENTKGFNLQKIQFNIVQIQHKIKEQFQVIMKMVTHACIYKPTHMHKHVPHTHAQEVPVTSFCSLTPTIQLSPVFSENLVLLF